MCNLQLVIKLFSLVFFTGIMASCQPEENGPDGYIPTTGMDTVQYLNIPQRPTDALSGSEFAAKVDGWSKRGREEAIISEILSGNVPAFSRMLKPVKMSRELRGRFYELILFVSADYMAIGSDEDYFYMPMTPGCAQALADSLHCLLPSKRMVDSIYAQAGLKLYPQPIPPSALMTTVPVFKQHTDSVMLQIHEKGIDRPTGLLVGGHKKDIIISNKIYSADRDFDRVVIYGWHRSENDPIQPVYSGHSASYADYSHGVRLVAAHAWLNDELVRVDSLLAEGELCSLLSHEGPILKAYY